jgi:hypothetical protein
MPIIWGWYPLLHMLRPSFVCLLEKMSMECFLFLSENKEHKFDFLICLLSETLSENMFHLHVFSISCFKLFTHCRCKSCRNNLVKASTQKATALMCPDCSRPIRKNLWFWLFQSLWLDDFFRHEVIVSTLLCFFAANNIAAGFRPENYEIQVFELQKSVVNNLFQLWVAHPLSLCQHAIVSKEMNSMNNASNWIPYLLCVNPLFSSSSVCLN